MINKKLDFEERVDGNFKTIDSRFKTMDSRFKTIDSRFKTMDKKFDDTGTRLTHIEVLFEEMGDKFDALTEIVISIRDELRGCAKQEDLEEVKQDVKIMRMVLTDTNSIVNDHEVRITKLETA